MRKHWVIKELSDRRFELAVALSVTPITAQLLLNRNINDRAGAQMMFAPSLRQLHSPLLLPDIDAVCARIRKAIAKHERIMICGDYDVDGITSVAMMVSYFKKQDTTVQAYIPHRLKEGYGLKDTAITEALRQNTHLIICVDCGTNSYEQIDRALKHGIDVIIIDHHKVTSPHPLSLLVNPKRSDSTYPFKDLCSAALTFKVIQALSGDNAYDLLDLAVLATIADVAPLVGENRIIAREGIAYLKDTKNIGLIELMKKARVRPESISTFHIGFLLGPRLNAAGRISTAYDSLNLLLEENQQKAEDWADKLQTMNSERQKIGNAAYKQALARVEQTTDFSKEQVIIVDDQWHPGIIGIVASRITDLFHRPTFIISWQQNDPVGKGSGRSIDSFHITDALEQCSSLLINYGGHEQAAGIEIERANIKPFKNKINQIAQQMLTKEHLVPAIVIDFVMSLEDITKTLIKELDVFRPFGEGNPPPLFMTRKVWAKTNPRSIENNKFALYVTDGKLVYEAVVNQALEAILAADRAKVFDLAYYPTLSCFDGHEQIVLNAVDIRHNNPA